MERNKKEIVYTKSAPDPIGPYSQAVKLAMPIEGLVFASGQIAINPADGVIPDGIEAQTHQVLNNVKAILEQAGTGLEQVIKTTVFLSDMNHFQAMNAVYGEYFTGDCCPARSAVEVSRLPKDVLVEIEVIAQL